MVTVRMLGDRYQIEEPPIGQGGMGVVYRAFDRIKECFVAIKTLKGDMDPHSIEIFRREWRLLAQLSHPNIVDVLDVGDFSDKGHQRPYFVMPLLPGCTLDQLIKTSGSRLTPERIVDIMCQTCRGLQAAHDRGLVHRDLKPSNLFVMNDDTVKIIDFGIVHLADAQSRTGVKGTLQYMAPEQVEMKPANTRSDIFSLGVVCYEALTGRKPFERSTTDEVIEAIRTYMPPPASELNPATNGQLSRTVQKAMAKQPYHRFSSAKEFSEILQRSLRNEHIELFDRSRIQPRLNRIKKALHDGDYQLAVDMLDELESEGNLDAEISVLRDKTEQAARARTIYQLIESARTRMEEGEYPLAMQNVQRVLDLDSSNADALAMKTEVEQRRTAAQVDKWLQIARQHHDNKVFEKARQAIDAVREFDRSNPVATELLASIRRGEDETNRLHQEKQQLYDEARNAYRNGEISGALSKLETVLDLGKRVPGHAATDAQYLALYEDICSQRDELQHSYAEGKRALETRDFARAVEICNEGLRQRPGEALFVALKIEVEEARRQEHSSNIAKLQMEIEAERDLDRKLAIVTDAVRRFPEELMFSQSLKLIKERRDLVQSLLARARHYESQHLFSEAKNQWDTIRKVYSLYPGLDHELQRLSRKQEEYGKEEAKAGWVSQIDRALFLGDYARAEGLLASALQEAPEDGELLRLKEQLQESEQRSAQAHSLLEEGQRLADAGDRPTAIQKLRAAWELNSGDTLIRDALRTTLVEHAKALTEEDWRAAVPFIEQGLQIDRTDPDAVSVSRLVDDLRRREQIDRYVMEARALQTERRLNEAIAKVEEALREYPNEIRLLQLRNTLRDSEAALIANGSRRQGATSVPAPPPPISLQPKAAGAPRDEIFATPYLTRRAPTPRSLTMQLAGLPFHSVAAVVVAALLLLVLGLRVVLKFRERSPAGTGSVFEVQPLHSGAGSPDGKLLSRRRDFTKSYYSFHIETSQPDHALVTVNKNSEWHCTTPCSLKLPAGVQTLQIFAPGYEAATRVVQVPLERELTQELIAEPKTVRISSTPPDLNIAVDSQAKGRTPVTLQLSVGSHNVTLTKADKTIECIIHVTPDDFIFPISFPSDAASPTGGK